MARRSDKVPDPRLIDPRNRVALSKAAMRALGVRAGDFVTFDVAEDGTVRIHRLELRVVPAGRPAEPTPASRRPPSDSPLSKP